MSTQGAGLNRHSRSEQNSGEHLSCFVFLQVAACIWNEALERQRSRRKKSAG